MMVHLYHHYNKMYKNYDDLNVWQQLDVLKELEPGWDGSDADPIDKNILAIVRMALQNLLKDISSLREGNSFPKGQDIEEPKIGAVDDGRIDLCWGPAHGNLWFTVDNDSLRIQRTPILDIPLEGNSVEERGASLEKELHKTLMQ